MCLGLGVGQEGQAHPEAKDWATQRPRVTRGAQGSV